MEAQKSKKEVTKPNYQYIRDKDREMVKGIFRYHEVPGGAFALSIKLHKGDQVETYTFKDGEVRSIPLGVARHLNRNVWYPEYGYVKGEDHQHLAQIVKKIRRVSFQSLEFVDIEDFGNETVKSSEASV